MLKKEKRHDSAHKNLPGVNNSNAGILQILNRCAFGSGRDVFKKHDSANERTGKAWKRSMKATGIVRRIDSSVIIGAKVRSLENTGFSLIFVQLNLPKSTRKSTFYTI